MTHDRRALLRLASALAGGALLPPTGAWAGRGAPHDPFALGVASGSPAPDGCVLWTRIAPDALPTPQSTAAVRWELADDEKFARIVASGEAPAVPELGHAVHVELNGLRPDRWYFYRFTLGDAVSDTGRTRTLPAADVLAARLRFAFASCQRWEHGYYAAWRRLAQDQPDLVVFLGDYMYEYAMPKDAKVQLARSHPLRHALTLADFRDRYALHKSDPDLQACRDPMKGPGGSVKRATCPQVDDPGRTLLGTAQERWLAEGLAADARPDGPRWTIVAQQTLFSPRLYSADGSGTIPADCWDGYPAARQRLLDTLAAARPRNPVFIGGDLHQNFVCNVHTQAGRVDSPALATEFCGTSISSFSGTTQQRVDAWRARHNPHIVYANPEKRGYTLAELTPQGFATTLQGVDDALRADSVVSPLARFMVEDRRPVVQPA